MIFYCSNNRGLLSMQLFLRCLCYKLYNRWINGTFNYLSLVHLKGIGKDSSSTPPTTSTTGGGGNTRRKKAVTSSSSDVCIRRESFVMVQAIQAHSDIQMSSKFQFGDCHCV